MTQNDFNSVFQDLMMNPTSPPRDPHSLAIDLFRRDQRRTRILAALALFFWLLFAAGMLLLLYGLNKFVLFIRIDPTLSWNSANHPTTQAILASHEDLMFWGTDLIHHSLPYIAGSVVALPLAALCTVLLVFSSRQATLKRINLSLMQISSQLSQRSEATTSAGGPSEARAENQNRYAWADQPPGVNPIIAQFISTALIVLLLAVCGWITFVYVRTATHWSGYDRLSPFEAIQWQQEVPQVEVDGVWYQLLAVNDVPVDEIVSLSKSMGPSLWKKHFNEDLVELLTRMGHPPGRTATLQVQDLNTLKVQVLKEVPMTESNRQAIFRADTTQP